MITNNNKHMIINEIGWIRQLIISHITFLSISEVSAVFNTPFPYPNTFFLNKGFLSKHFLISKYLSILNVILHSQSHVLGFPSHIIIFTRTPNHLIICTHTDIHYDFIFALNYIHFHSIYIYTHTIHVALKILFHLPLIVN